MKTPIKSIAEEKADCIAAFEANPTARYAYTCHHRSPAEELTEPYMNRIDYILRAKPVYEQARRLRNFRPVIDETSIARIFDEYFSATKPAYERQREESIANNYVFESKANPAFVKYWEVQGPFAIRAEAQIAPIRDQEWPDHTWNGESIFDYPQS